MSARYFVGRLPLLFMVGFCGICLFGGSECFGQARDRDRGKKEDPNAQDLAKRLSKAEELLLTEYTEVANEYYKKGEREAASQVLKRILEINPKQEGIQKQIDSINEELLQENGLKVRFDVANRWMPVCEVEEGKPIRIKATGDYKLDLTTPVPLTGLSTKDPGTDYIPVAPFGALFGVVVTGDKPGEPFAITDSMELTPRKSGVLIVRVNTPAAAKCKGDLELQLSGAVKAATKRR
ncbi:MAG: hypothetical protein ACK58L_08560 [Planctomycetota bacterium]